MTDELQLLKDQIRALKFVVIQQQRDIALLTEFLRTKRPVDFRSFEDWSEKQSLLWDAADARNTARADEMEAEILADMRNKKI